LIGKWYQRRAHVKALNFKKEDVAAFMQTVAHIGDKKGCLLAQFPPSLKNG